MERDEWPNFIEGQLRKTARATLRGVAFGALPRGMPCCERRVPSLRCLVALFVALNTLNYVDRGIIPGASEEFEAFICESRGLGAHGCRHASTFLGLL